MDRQLIVEVLDRRGHVVDRHRLDQFPAMLGRGYGCAVILDDRFVSPEHALVDIGADGGFAVLDLGSLNGLREVGSRRRVPRVAVGPGTRIRIGQTVLRFCFPDQPVADAIREVGESLTVATLALTPGRGLAIGAVAAGWLGLLTFLGSFDGDRGTSGAATVIGIVLMIVVWSGIWALLGRLLVHRPRFSLHVGLAGLAILASIVIEITVSYAQFLTPQSEAIATVGAVLNVLVFGALLAGTLSLATALPRRRRLAIGFGLSIGIAGLAALGVSAFDSQPDRAARFEGEVKALGQPWVHTVTSEGFFAEVERLVARVDSLAAHEAAAIDSSSVDTTSLP